jgi:hypothetical protein
MGEVIETPLIKNNWLITMPVREHSASSGQSFFAGQALPPEKPKLIVKKIIATITRAAFKANAGIYPGVMIFTIE